jgi:hypothetical protein
MTMKMVVFDCDKDDMIPMTGQILFTDFGSGLHQLAWRPSKWHSWSPPLFPEEVQVHEPQSTADD